MCKFTYIDFTDGLGVRYYHKNKSKQEQEVSMPRLLHVQSGPNFGNLVTQVLFEKYVQVWVSNHANVEVLDLAAANPSCI